MGRDGLGLDRVNEYWRKVERRKPIQRKEIMKSGNPAHCALILVAKDNDTWSVDVIFCAHDLRVDMEKSSPEGPDCRTLLIDKWATKSRHMFNTLTDEGWIRGQDGAVAQ